MPHRLKNNKGNNDRLQFKQSMKPLYYRRIIVKRPSTFKQTKNKSGNLRNQGVSLKLNGTASGL